MKVLRILSGCLFVLVVFFVLWYVVSDYSDGVASGTYHFAQDGQTSILVLKPEHTFQRDRHGALDLPDDHRVTWRPLVGEC